MLLKDERQPAIVYAPTRKQAESVADALGPQAYAYHAGMPAEKRSRIQTRFINGDIGIIVATVAFGMVSISRMLEPFVTLLAHRL